MVSTAQELVIFINNVFNGNLLSANSLENMTHFYHLEKQDHPYWKGYGLGLAQFNINGVEYWGHEGIFIGFELILLFNPQKKYSIALIGNVSSYDKVEIIRHIQEIL